MTKRLLFIIGLNVIISLSSLLLADPQAGLYKTTIKEGWNLVSLPLQTLQLTQGKITALTSNTLTDSSKSWTDNEYQYDILMISSGSGEGYYYRISANNSNTVTLTSDISSAVAAGDLFYVYKTYTLAEIFGDHTGSLKAAETSEDADVIYLWNNSSQSLSEPIWLCNQSGNEGWRQGDTKITDNSISLLPNEACFLVHKISDEVTINYLGIVPDTKQTINIKDGETLCGQSYPAAVTMGNCGLDSLLQSGASSYSADNIYFWDYEEQKFKLPAWHSNSSGYENWYQGADNVNTFNFTPGEGFLIRNRGSELNWQREKPY